MARTYEQAAKIVRSDALLDLILVDYKLDDGGTGPDIVQALEAEFGALVPAILITAEPLDLADVADCPTIIAVLQKPVAPAGLRAQIRRSMVGVAAQS